LTILSVLFTAPAAHPQRHRPDNLEENVQLPPDFALDYQLGLTMRTQVHGSSGLVTGTPMNLAGEAVFQSLLSDNTIQGLLLPYRWNLTILNNDAVINAYSLPDGEICVSSGLAKLIGTNQGLWAAVLSHEAEHTVRRHWVRKYMFELYVQQQLVYYQARVAAGDKNANWSIVGLRIATPIARARLSRNLEHDADVQGMMLMAREGYHPDNVFALHHLMRATTGEQSKFAAFFSTHPRWATRDQRDDKAYLDALTEYNRLWPDPGSSPGGMPPVVAFAGKPTAQENRQGGTADLTLPVYCRNSLEPVQAVVYFEKDHQLLRAPMPDFSDTKGNLVFRQQFACSEKGEANPIVLHLPVALVREGEHNVEATVEIFSSGGDFLDEFKPVTFNFPKRYTARQSPTGSTNIHRDNNGSSVMTITPLKDGPVGGNNSATSGQAGSLTPSSKAQSVPASSVLTINSVPVGADIFRDNDFVGNTPSTINVPLGKHVVTVRKIGFQDWVSNMNLNGGSITLNAELAPATRAALHTPNPLAVADTSKEPVASPGSTNLLQTPVGWIGVHAQNKDDDAVVTNVNPNSPGAKAGIEVGDIILALDGRLVKGRDFETLVAALKPGTQISINYVRGSLAQQVWLTVGSHAM
jgi:hypothetical protein